MKMPIGPINAMPIQNAAGRCKAHVASARCFVISLLTPRSFKNQASISLRTLYLGEPIEVFFDELAIRFRTILTHSFQQLLPDAWLHTHEYGSSRKVQIVWFKLACQAGVQHGGKLAR